MDEKLIIKKLEHRTVKPTAMRILVMRVLMEQKDCAMSLNDIEMEFSNADRVTLFRTLKTFEQHKLIHHVDDGTGMIKYALCEDDCDCTGSQHPHFYCIHCNKTYCMKSTPIPEINLPKHFKMQEVSIVTKGFCKKCDTKHIMNKS